MSKYQLKESTDHQFYFNLVGSNGEVLLTSERYTARASARNGVGAVRDNSTVDARYNRLVSEAGEPYFVLKANNGQVLATSEMYSSPSARDGGIEAVKRAAPTARLEE